MSLNPSKPTSLSPAPVTSSLGASVAVLPTASQLADNPIAEILSAVKIRDVVPAREPVMLRSYDTVGACIATLTKQNLHSVPVLREGTCVGFVDILEICRHIAASSPDPEHASREELANYARELCHSTPVSELLDPNHSSGFYAVHESEPASNAATILARGVHRMAMYSDVDDRATAGATGRAAKFTGVCSQSDLVRWIGQLAAKPDASPALQSMLKRGVHSFVGQGLHLQAQWLSSELLAKHKKPEKASMPGFQVLGISEKATLLAAIQKMALARCRALALVDSAGHLTGNFSAADLAPLFEHKGDHDEVVTSLFFSPIKEYLTKHRPHACKPIANDDPDAPLGSIIKTMCEKKVHHVWMMNKGDPRPAGIITLTDILRIVAVFNAPQERKAEPKKETQFDVSASHM